MSVHGHVRSGTHWLRVVMSLNFRYNGRARGMGHGFPGPWINGQPNVFYIKREFDGVARSMWNLKERFGIGAGTFEEFVDTPWKDQWTKHPPSLMSLGSHERRKLKEVPTDGHFRSIAMTPRQYHKHHVKKWTEFGASSLTIVDYDRLVADFDAEMQIIASALGSSKTSFENIPRTGPWKHGEEW